MRHNYFIHSSPLHFILSMKTLLMTLSAGLLLTLAGCGKKSDPNPSGSNNGGSVGTSSLKANLTGESDFVSTDTNVVAGIGASSDPNEAPAVLLIRAREATGDRNIYMEVDKYTGPGTYQFKATSLVNSQYIGPGHAFYNYGGAGGTYFKTVDAAPIGTATGQLVVSTSDKASAHLTGTFTFKGSDGKTTKTFSNGTFDIYYVLGL